MSIAIDSDAHVGPQTLAELAPFLPVEWHGQLEAAERFGMQRFPLRHPPAALADGERPLQLAGRRVAHAVLTPSTGLETARNVYFSAAACRAVNDWTRERVLGRDATARASVVVPLHDVDAAIEEVDRCAAADAGFVQVLLPVRSETPLGVRRFHRLFEAIERHGLVAGLHAGGDPTSLATPNGAPGCHLEQHVADADVAQAQIASLVCEGVLGRFPTLRFAVLECGIAWLPGFLWRFDKDWRGLAREVPWVRERPSVTIRARFRFSLAPAGAPDEPQALADVLRLATVAEVGMLASDFPHRGVDRAAPILAALDDEDAREAVAWRTAAAWYGLDPRELPNPNRPDDGGRR